MAKQICDCFNQNDSAGAGSLELEPLNPSVEKIKILQKFERSKNWNEKTLRSMMLEYLNKFITLNTGEAESFFSFFMPKWYDLKPTGKCKVLRKVKMFCDVGLDLESVLSQNSGQPASRSTGPENEPELKFTLFYGELIKLFNNGSNAHYHSVLFMLVTRLLEEMEEANSSNFYAELKNIKQTFGDSKLRSELKIKIMQIVLAFGANDQQLTKSVILWLNRIKGQTEERIRLRSGSVIVAWRSIELKSFVELCDSLINEQVVKFRKLLLQYIEDSKAAFGDGYHVPVHLSITILSIMADKFELFQTQAFIVQEFPFIGFNSTVMNSLSRGSEFMRFKVFKFKDEKLEKWVRSRFIRNRSLNFNFIHFKACCNH